MNWTAPPDCALPDPLADWLDEPLDFELSDPLADGWLDGLLDFELSDPLADGWLDAPPDFELSEPLAEGWLDEPPEPVCAAAGTASSVAPSRTNIVCLFNMDFAWV